jgi:hypothetical protein
MPKTNITKQEQAEILKQVARKTRENYQSEMQKKEAGDADTILLEKLNKAL